MTLFKWPEEDLRQKFCNMTFKGLKTNPKPVKDESWRRPGGQLTERLSCCLHNYRFWTNGWQLSSSFLFEGQMTLNILKNTLLCCNEFESAPFISEDHRKLRKLWTLRWQTSGKTQHTRLFTSEGELRTDQSHDCSKSTWWTNDFWLLLLMNMGEGLLCKQKRWLKSSCIPGNPPQPGWPSGPLELLHSLQRLNSWRVSSLCNSVLIRSLPSHSFLLLIMLGRGCRDSPKFLFP